MNTKEALAIGSCGTTLDGSCQTSVKMNTVNIEIVSDFACPWCFLGKRRLEQAIKLRPDLQATLDWRPFQLNPKMPRKGSNRRDYYRTKFGEEAMKGLRENLNNAGLEEGIVFCDTPDAVAPNTLSAHVLMSWAIAEENVDANDLAEEIFSAHHVACENIGDHEVLARIAGHVGMNESRVSSRLVAGDDERIVSGQIRRAAARGASGVPFFIIDNRYGISGAQSAETLAAVFDRVAKAEDQQQ